MTFPLIGKLFVRLYKNPLSDKKDEYMGKIIQGDYRTLEDIAEITHNRGCQFTKEQLVLAAKELAETQAYCLAKGCPVNTGLGIAYPVVAGVFTSSGATPPARNKPHITVAFSASATTRSILKEAVIDVIGIARIEPIINKVVDFDTGEQNGLITPGKLLRIFGSRLSIKGEDERVGIHFISASDSSVRMSVDRRDIVDNTPSKLLVVTPELPVGDWYLELASQDMGKRNRLLKNPRICRFKIPLSVIKHE